MWARPHERGLRLFQFESRDFFRDLHRAQFFAPLAIKHLHIFELRLGNAAALNRFAMTHQLGFGISLRGPHFFQLRLDLAQRGLGAFHAGFRLGDAPGIEQLGVARLDHREQRFAGFDLVARVHADPQDAAVERRGDDVLVANPRLAVFVDRHAHRAAIDLHQIDLHRLRQKRIHQPADDRRGDEENKQLCCRGYA